MIAFTGSPLWADRSPATAGRTLKRVALELGAKIPCWCCPTPIWKLQHALALRHVSFHQSQVCLAVGIHLVHKALIDRYAARVAELAKANQSRRPVPADMVGLAPSSMRSSESHLLYRCKSYQAGAELVRVGPLKGFSSTDCPEKRSTEHSRF